MSNFDLPRNETFVTYDKYKTEPSEADQISFQQLTHGGKTN